MTKIADFLNKNDRFAADAGCRILEMEEGRAVAEMTVTPHHLNGGGVCQGGALFTLADLALAAVMNSRGQLTFGIENNIMFMASARVGTACRSPRGGRPSEDSNRRSPYYESEWTTLVCGDRCGLS